MLIPALGLKRKHLFVGPIFGNGCVNFDRISEIHGMQKRKILLQVNRPGARKARAEESRYVRSRQHAVRNTLSEARRGSIRLIEMHRIHIARHPSEGFDVLSRNDAAQGALLSY